MSKFTEGPWRVANQGADVRRNNLLIASVYDHAADQDECEGCANARLIAAAPDLYAVVVAMMDKKVSPEQLLVMACAALARVEGTDK